MFDERSITVLGDGRAEAAFGHEAPIGGHGLRRLGVVALAAALFLGGVGFERATATEASATTGAHQGELALLGQAWDLLDREYVDAGDLDPIVLIRGAIEGMAYAVGDTGHTYLLTPDEAAAEDQALSSSAGGTGQPAVDWALVPGTKTALIRLTIFSEGSAGEVRAAVDRATEAGATGLVLDLRGNPGGWEDEAVGVASVFLGAGEVVLRERGADHREVEVTVPADAAPTHLPLVVLVDADSASCAEIVAGALQDAHRATLVGTTTTGTGTLMTDFPLKDGSILSIGTSEWLTPAGRSAWHVGLAPDVNVELPPGVGPVRPDQLATLGSKRLAKSGDAQLLRALAILRVGGG